MIYSDTYCFGCDKLLDNIGSITNRYICNNKDCKINYDINVGTNRITFDINHNDETYSIAISFMYNKTFIDQLSSPATKYFHIANQALDMSLEEWGKYIERLEKLQVLQ